jgi:hypothetical protein
VQHGRLTPVRLISIEKEMSSKRAAWWLLEHYGLARPRPWQDRLQETLRERSETDPGLGDPRELVEALHEALRAHPAYPAAGLAPELQDELERELARLDAVYAIGDREAIKAWYREARRRLWKTLDEQAYSPVE